MRSYLSDLAGGRGQDVAFERLRRLQDETLASIRARGGGLRSADNLSRDALHDRDALR